MMLDIDSAIRERANKFWSGVNRRGPDDCWHWLRSCNVEKTSHLPYGRFYISKSKVVRAHRAAWVLVNGAIPDGLCVLLRCDNPKCCNPNHLWLGTLADNNHDRDKKGRARHVARDFASVNWCRGEKHWAAKLTLEQARAIHTDPRSLSVLAKEYGVHFATISKIKTGRKWSRAIAAKLEDTP